jgi:hypothetical protein
VEVKVSAYVHAVVEHICCFPSFRNNLPTRLNGLAEHRVLLDHPLLFEMFRIKKLMVRKGEKMETTMINGGR